MKFNERPRELLLKFCSKFYYAQLSGLGNVTD
jgi:hypothetical protein